jgi:hypothetical protein
MMVRYEYIVLILYIAGYVSVDNINKLIEGEGIKWR